MLWYWTWTSDSIQSQNEITYSWSHTQYPGRVLSQIPFLLWYQLSASEALRDCHTSSWVPERVLTLQTFFFFLKLLTTFWFSKHNKYGTGKKKRLSYLVGNLVATNWPIEKALHAIGYNQIPTEIAQLVRAFLFACTVYVYRDFRKKKKSHLKFCLSNAFSNAVNVGVSFGHVCPSHKHVSKNSCHGLSIKHAEQSAPVQWTAEVNIR